MPPMAISMYSNKRRPRHRAIYVVFPSLCLIIACFSLFTWLSSTDPTTNERYRAPPPSQETLEDEPSHLIANRNHAVPTEQDNRPWWMQKLDLEDVPWNWSYEAEGDPETDERTLMELAFPCEGDCGEVVCPSAVRKLRSQCRKEFPHPVTVFEGMTEASVETYLTTHKANISRQCHSDLNRLRYEMKTKQKIPALQFNPPREAFTLADVAAALAVGREGASNELDPRPESNVRILFMGDSVGNEFFQQARCHIMRTVEKKTGKVTTFEKGPALNYWPNPSLVLAREKRNRLEYMQSSDFTIPVASVPPITLSLSFQLSNRALTDDLELLLDSCLRNDLVVFDWGLHYFNPFAGEYYQQMIPVLGQFQKCLQQSKGRTTIVYANHPAQHFFDLFPTGWYFPHDNQHEVVCKPVPFDRIKSMDELDGWTQVLRNITREHHRAQEGKKRLSLTPVPWGREKVAYCPTRLREEDRIFFVPYIDLTASFHRLHRANKPGDCTHLTSLPHLGTPLWDALYWSVLQQQNERLGRCSKSAPVPAFSALAKFRGSTRQNIVNENFAEHFRESQASDGKLMPLIEKRGKSTGEWDRIRKQWMKDNNFPGIE